MKYATYEKYTDSPLEWSGPIPAHWQIKKIGHLVLLKSGENIVSEEIAEGGKYPVFGGNGFRGYFNQYTHDGNFVLIGRQGALCGNINYARGKFWASEHALVAHPLAAFDLRWFGETLRAMNLNQYSVSAAQPGLAASAISALRLPFPPIDEQQTIARFLDAKTAQIDALVAQKRQLIAKLKEKRQALIARTVTRGLPPEAAKAAGLEPNPEVKDSGVEWVGQIPGHWDIEKFSREVHIAEGQVDPEIEPFASMYLIAPNHIESGTGRLLALETAAEQFAESGKYLCPADAVIYSKIRPALRKVVIASEQCLCSADMYPLTCKKKLQNPYLYWLLLSDQFSAWSVLEADRVAMPKINRETLNELRLPIPPQNEQLKIVEYLAAETTKVDHMLAKADAVISSLTEYRQALITAAVTGKIDVHGSAPSDQECT